MCMCIYIYDSVSVKKNIWEKKRKRIIKIMS